MYSASTAVTQSKLAVWYHWMHVRVWGGPTIPETWRTMVVRWPMSRLLNNNATLLQTYPSISSRHVSTICSYIFHPSHFHCRICLACGSCIQSGVIRVANINKKKHVNIYRGRRWFPPCFHDGCPQHSTTMIVSQLLARVPPARTNSSASGGNFPGSKSAWRWSRTPARGALFWANYKRKDLLSTWSLKSEVLTFVSIMVLISFDMFCGFGTQYPLDGDFLWFLEVWKGPCQDRSPQAWQYPVWDDKRRRWDRWPLETSWVGACPCQGEVGTWLVRSVRWWLEI